VSADGNYVAAVNHTHLMYFSVKNKTIQWTFNVTEANEQNYVDYLLGILTVTISSNGTYVAIGYGGSAVGSDDGGVSYFNESTKRNGEIIEPTWTNWFIKMNGRVDRRCLDISDDGEYVAVAGTGTCIYFFENCSKLRGEGNGIYNWTANWSNIEELLCIDLTPDGRYMVAGGYLNDDNLTLGYVNQTGDLLWYWSSIEWNGTVWDVAISDDGSSVVLGLSYHTGDPNDTEYGVRYFNNSYNLAGVDPPATWWYTSSNIPGMNVSVDLSGSGNEVIYGDQYLTSWEYWYDAKNRYGSSYAPIGSGMIVYDVSISEDGTIIAVVGKVEHPVISVEDFGKDRGSTIVLNSTAKVLSMSSDGAIIATGGEGGSLYMVRYIREPVIEPIQPVGGVINPTLMSKLSIIVLVLLIIIFSSFILLKKQYNKISQIKM